MARVPPSFLSISPSSTPPPSWAFLHPPPPPPSSDNSSSARNIACAIFVAIATFFLICSCLRKRCKARRARRESAAAATAAASRLRPPPEPGVRGDDDDDERQLHRPCAASPTPRLPAFTYTRSVRHNVMGVVREETATCSVCLGAFRLGESVRLMPACLHLYHVECIDPWLDAHSTCPVCRSDTDPTRDVAGLAPV